MECENKLYTRPSYLTTVHPCNIGTILHHLNEKDFDLNAHYQRDYVWGPKERFELMESILSDRPIGSVCVTIRDKSLNEGYLEVVDGKQRITTIQKFVNNEFDHRGYYWRDLDRTEQNQIKHIKIGWILLEMRDEQAIVDDSVILDYFYGVNFTGQPQSEEHKNHIINLMGGKQWS